MAERKKTTEPQPPVPIKRCGKCRQDKPTTEFSKNTGRYDGLQSICKACSSEYSRTHREQINATARNRNKERSIWPGTRVYTHRGKAVVRADSNGVFLEGTHENRKVRVKVRTELPNGNIHWEDIATLIIIRDDEDIR